MDNEMKVLKLRYIIAMSVCFAAGLLFGLVIHLPAVSFDDDVTNDNNVAMEITDFNSWSGVSKRLNGKPVGRVQSVKKRSLKDAEFTVTINLKPEVEATPRKPSLDSTQHVDGIFWSDSLEKQVPKGYTDNDLDLWRSFSRSSKLVNMETGCGRMQNRLLTFEDGTKGCARYRINTDQMQGEVYSFYLARLIGITNIPPLAILKADQRQSQWTKVSSQVTEAQWSDEKPVVVTKFAEDLVPAYIPTAFRPDDRKLNSDSLLDLSHQELLELVQWSDLVIFDYLTGNLDRVINNMFNKQWNSEVMDSPAHNLERKDNFLYFLDNESGLFHGYRLLDKYQYLHKNLLDAVCIFRRGTIAKLRDYNENGRIGDDIHESVQTYEPLHDLFPKLPENTVKILQERIGHVLQQVDTCQRNLKR